MEYLDEFKGAFENTYQSIAFDLCDCGEDGTIEREELFWMCCDFLYIYGELDEEASEWWAILTRDEKLQYLPLVFPYTHYEVGMAS